MKLIPLILFTLIFNYTLFAQKTEQTITYSIEEETHFDFEGTTNINSFDCQCKDKYPKNTLKAIVENGKKIKFINGKIQLKAQKLDCNNAKMNKDLCAAIKAEQYPIILVELDEAQIENTNFSNPEDWIYFKATVILTITNICRKVSMNVKAKRLSPGKYRFVSTLNLLLTDFGVEPPTALFGLIKVDNKIKINFDLYTILDGDIE